MKPLLIKESLELLNKGGKLIYYWRSGCPKIRFGGEHDVDGRTYQGLLSRGIKPEIIGYDESFEYQV